MFRRLSAIQILDFEKLLSTLTEDSGGYLNSAKSVGFRSFLIIKNLSFVTVKHLKYYAMFAASFLLSRNFILY